MKTNTNKDKYGFPIICPRCGDKVGGQLFCGGNGTFYGLTHASNSCGKLMVYQDGREVIGETEEIEPVYGLFGWVFGETRKRCGLIFGKRKYKYQ